MKYIPLSQGEISLVDDCDYDAVLAVGKWYYIRSGYACHYWRDVNGRRHSLFLHRFIYARVLGYAIPHGLQIDHRSAREQGKQARLDNQRPNLRLATASENQAFKSAQANTRSHKGCTLRQGKFDVRLRYYHHRLHLGRFVDFYLAVAAYSYAHRILWGEFTSEIGNDTPLPENVQDKIDQQIALLFQGVSRLESLWN